MSTLESAVTRADTAPAREAVALTQITERLQARFPHLAVERIHSSVQQHYQSLANARVRDYIPVLVERATRNELAALSANGA
jgi:hypothetical protein